LNRLRLLLPQVITAARLLASAGALIAAIEDYLTSAVRLIVIGMVVDSFDGPIAKRLGATSDFGAQFDYYSDYLGNVVAPSVIVFLLLRDQLGHWAVVPASVPMLTGAVRYARNVIMARERSFEHAGYPGLGTVFFALFVVEMILLDAPALLGDTWFSLVLAVTTVLLSFAMLGRWRYPKLTKFQIINVALCSLVVIHLFAFTSLLGTLVLVAVVGYALAGPLISHSES
jgi:CDP-diacylglycerol--serine O-phosphatidyltransferase